MEYNYINADILNSHCIRKLLRTQETFAFTDIQNTGTTVTCWIYKCHLTIQLHCSVRSSRTSKDSSDSLRQSYSFSFINISTNLKCQDYCPDPMNLHLKDRPMLR